MTKTQTFQPGTYTCDDRDCPRHTKPFKNPYIMQNGGRAGKAVCPECTSVKITKVG